MTGSEIFPDIVKFIMLYTLDTYNTKESCVGARTSAAAMHYLTNWMNHFAETLLSDPLRILSGDEVTLIPGSPVYEALKRGAAVQVRLILECPHYVLLTGLTDDGRVLLFDPYYEEEDDPEFDEEYRTDEIHFLYDMPKRANRSVSIERLEPHRFRLLRDVRPGTARGRDHGADNGRAVLSIEPHMD